MARGFLAHDPNQRLLLPPDIREWLPEGHLASFVADVLEDLDLSSILCEYEGEESRGRAGYHPKMMLKLLVYGYCVGRASSRKIERATYEDVAFRVLACDQHPDHDSIADFRKRHLKAIGNLFMQVLHICEKAGLVKLGHIAIDGTKMGANASKHKAMSYERMEAAEKKLREEIESLLAEAERTDAEEDARFGKGKRGDELPGELRRRESRLKKIGEAKAALEAEAKAKAEHAVAEATAKNDARAKKEDETGKKQSGRPPAVPKDPETAKPEPKAQRNFTDPESRIMPDGANKGAFVQAYNAQIAVDAHAQIIVALDLTQQTNDKRQLEPMAQQIVRNVERLADTTSADAGYFSERAIEAVEAMGTNLLVPPDRQKHATTDAAAPLGVNATTIARMRAKLHTGEARALYRMRKAIVEPVFGQIKAARGLRRFLLRGFANALQEFSLIAWTHNLLKLFRARTALAA